jgi:hypothetical protein
VIELLEQQKKLTANQWKLIATANLADLLDFFDFFLIGYVLAFITKEGNARVRRGMIHLAWRFLRFQKESALAQWYQARTADSRVGTRKTMIVALARKLLIALWRFVTTGETLEGVILRPAG